MESTGRTLVCSVLFVDIVEFSKEPAAGQLQLKQALNQSLATALAPVASRDRIILETDDGAAVAFMGDPEEALFAAVAIRDQPMPRGTGAASLRMGVNLGPVRLIKDLDDQMTIVGEGVGGAQRVMGHSDPGQLLVSRAFYEVVSRLSRDYSKLFRLEGARNDQRIREHDVYSVAGGPPSRSGDTRSQANSPQAGGLGMRRSALIAAPIIFLLALAFGIAARGMIFH